jgi:hypothetical protein
MSAAVRQFNVNVPGAANVARKIDLLEFGHNIRGAK